MKLIILYNYAKVIVYYDNILFVLKTHLKTYIHYKLKDVMLKYIGNLSLHPRSSKRKG